MPSFACHPLATLLGKSAHKIMSIIILLVNRSLYNLETYIFTPRVIERIILNLDWAVGSGTWSHDLLQFQPVRTYDDGHPLTARQ
jgi:hypothetical protein